MVWFLCGPAWSQEMDLKILMGFFQLEMPYDYMVLARIELKFLPRGSWDDAFRFLTRRILITHQCFSCSSAGIMQSKGLLFMLADQQEAWRCTRSREGTLPAQLIPADQRAILYHTTLYLTVKPGMRGGDVGRDGICLPKEHDEPCFPGSGRTSACQREAVNEFLVLLSLLS